MGRPKTIDTSHRGILDQASYDRVYSRLLERERLITSELARSINTAAAKVQDESAKDWEARMTTAPGYGRKRIRFARRARQNSLKAVVQTEQVVSRADRFRYRWLGHRQGVLINFRRGRPGKAQPKFFMRLARSDGTPLIMMRRKKYQKGESRTYARGVFKAIMGPSLNQHFHDSRKSVTPIAMSDAKAQFMKALRA